ncbi:MAG: ATP-binding cassette domain-containing protein [Acidobacteria bacterium]|nr:MAG: ATP-binding cassette domain-containing protein [Acidobacteriota bacterium]
MIELLGVHKSFDGKPVLRGVDLAVRPGETLVVLGASGSGKSVTLRHIVGLTRPDRGVVRVLGREIQDLSEDELVPVRREIGFLFQGGALFDSMDVAENVGFPLREAGWDEERIDRRIDEVLGLVGLDRSVRALMPASLSGGMRKRVALARAIAVTPQAILYDEPTTGLDPVTANTINDLILSMQRQLGVTSVVVTHDIVSAFKVGNRIAFLHEGVIRFLGTVEEARRCDDPVFSGFIRGGVLEADHGS